MSVISSRKSRANPFHTAMLQHMVFAQKGTLALIVASATSGRFTWGLCGCGYRATAATLLPQTHPDFPLGSVKVYDHMQV